MKKEVLKIATIFLITIGVVVWGLNYIFFGAPKSKATGETMNLSFTPATATVAANADFTVNILAKPSINTVLRGYTTHVNFDKTKLAFKSIQYKVGVVSADLGNTTAHVASVNAQGFITITGEDTTATGYTLGAANGAEIVSITFTALAATATTVTFSDSSFYSVNSDGTLFDTWTIAPTNLDVNGGGTITPSPTPTGVVTTGNVKLNLKLKFQGIGAKPPTDALSSMLVKFTLYDQTTGQNADYDIARVTSNEKGIWSGMSDLTVNTSHKFALLVKGPQHIQKKVCDSTPTETAGAGLYRCSAGNITLVAGDNNLDFSGILLLAGDLDQSGIVDSVDFGMVRNNLGKTDVATLAQADINRDGKVDTQDFSLIIAALGIRTDEQ